MSLSKSAGIVSTQVLNGERIVNSDLTNSTSTTLDTNALTVLDSGGNSTIFNSAGFAEVTSQSIDCNTNNGFRLINGAINTTHNLSKVELVNNTTTQDTILLQNTGGGNPVFNLVSNNTGTNLQEFSGQSVNGIGFTRTDTLTTASQSLSLYNDSAGGGILQYTSNLTTNPLTISTDKDLQLDITQDFVLNGGNIESGTSGGNSGQHLRIKLNGTYYKIRLEYD